MKYKYTNRLIEEKSPYLLQHAHNPVNWYPWCNEAFKRSSNENKPIFLSIGYSTCHWCHVMEKESFEDIEVAKLLNEHFIAIKVDREERPDIDSIYMDACQALTGGGGWPLTIFMDYHQRPFFAGTYFPKNTTFNHIGLIDLLKKIKDSWIDNKERLIESSNGITEALKSLSNNVNDKKLFNNVDDLAYNIFLHAFDTKFGGFGKQPKFPMPTNLYFLLRYYIESKDDKALLMVTYTLESMYRGGIYDHLGFGFSRYSTDNKWLVPHFEKMLYDNALLALIYTEAYQITKNKLFEKATDEIFTYIFRDMMSKEGAFYSAQDADSEGTEGKFYVWSYNEIMEVLGYDEGPVFAKQLNVTKRGNFEGKNILNLIGSEKINVNKKIRNKLFQYRKKRKHPHKDDKVLTSWNSLMIVALSVAGRVFKNDNYIYAAKNAAEFIFNELIDSDGRLLARYRDGTASILAYADDYASLIWGLIELYESTFESRYLEKAIKLNEELVKHFYDKKSGGLFMYSDDAEKLIIRPKEIYDNVIPSSNSISTLNWIRLARLTNNSDLEKLAIRQFEVFSNKINESPSSCTFLLSSYLYLNSKSKELIIVGDKEKTRTKEMLDILNTNFNPFITTLFIDTKGSDKILELMPHLKNYTSVNDVPTAYVCSNNTCSLPIIGINEFKDIF
ncbi:MAG: thioredoxin domain-containing protein [Clostridia bacterium]|nr:thioredoxin domain-containing protein [Clostridia bacterium]